MARLTIANVEKKLREKKGNVSAAARVFGVSRQAVSDFIKKHPDPLEQVLKDARESMVDDGENALAAAVKKGQGWAVCFLLKTQGQSRGYIEKQQHEHSGPGGTPIKADVKHEHKIDAAALAAFATDLAAAGLANLPADDNG